MRSYLYRLTTCGIKNLEKDVTLCFADETFSPIIKTENQNVKAIYGLNGAGKSALMASVDLVKNILVNRGYVARFPKLYFDELLNKKLGKFTFQADFAIYDENNNNKVLRNYSYSLEIGRSSQSQSGYGILHEVFYELVGRTLNEKKVLLFATNNGVLDSLTNESKVDSIIRTKTQNQLIESSLVSNVSQIFESGILNNELPNDEQTSPFLRECFSLSMFGYSLLVYMASADQHETYQSDSSATLAKLEKMNDADFRKFFLGFYNDSVISVEEQKINKNSLLTYKKNIAKLTLFIQLFKPDLLRIDLETKEDKNILHVSKIFVYKNYKIRSEFESTGIKKLVTLFAYFKSVSDGSIVFIDELDANLHDVYLGKLIDYFLTYGKGQLCFTTHNLGPMSYLADKKHGIDFLGVDNHLVSWVKSSHYQPYRQYPAGMIKYSPFNFEAFDFLQIFKN
jgi:hypothetical protein